MSNLPENDRIALQYIADKTGRFTELDIKVFGMDSTNRDISVMRTIVSEISDYDYEFEDSYVQIQMTLLVEMIKF